MQKCPITVGIIEDNNDLREYIEEIIKTASALKFVFSASSLKEARRKFALNQTDICLTDIGLPDGSGIDFTKEVKAKTNTKILILTVLGDRRSVLRALEAGADGYLLKDTPPEQLIRKIMTTIEGATPISPQAATHLLQAYTQGRLPHDENEVSEIEPLTEREREILKLFERGLSYRETAEALDIKENTIRTHVKAIYSKLNVSSRSEAIFEARQLYLLER